MATRKKRKEIIDDACELAGCSEKIRKIHFDQYVNRGWDPHPPEAFENWWSKHRHYSNGIDAKRAFNCQCYQDEFLESKQFGLNELGSEVSKPDSETNFQVAQAKAERTHG